MWMIRQVWLYIGFLFSARAPKHVHSPNLYSLLTGIHDDSGHREIFAAIENHRALLRRSEKRIPSLDYGAGSRVPSGSREKTVGEIARSALSKPLKCRVLFRLIAAEKPDSILELGTSLGILTAYMAAARPETQVATIEANPALVDQARSGCESLGLSNVDFHTGTFHDILPELLDHRHKIDFVVIDGDHRGDALLTYFALIRPFLSEQAIVIVDDVRWSPDMYAAWEVILADKAIPCILDYFGFGILLMSPEFLDPVRLRIRSAAGI